MTKFLVPDYFTFKVSVAKEQSTKYTKENMSQKYKYCNVFISIFGLFKKIPLPYINKFLIHQL